jgi:hypothetical protein
LSWFWTHLERASPSEILDISLKYCADRMSFGLAVEQCEELAMWFVRANDAALALEARKDAHERPTRIVRTSKKTRGNEGRPSALQDGCENISHIDVQADIGKVVRFALSESGYGDSRQALSISSGTACLSFGIYADAMENISAWLIAVKYAVGVVRARKEKLARLLEKELRSLHT